MKMCHADKWPVLNRQWLHQLGNHVIRHWLMTSVMLMLSAVLIGLGCWQLQRLHWKLGLIERVTARAHAEPVAPPSPADWVSLTADNAEYRRVVIHGRYDHAHQSRVRASTVLGTGYWLMTPLRLDDGTRVWINRGFLPMNSMPTNEDQAVDTPASLIGLIRITEPKGTLLQRNDPAHDRWYSRDVQALTLHHQLDASRTAPYFIDAEAAANAPSRPDDPVAGLTVLSFRNPHLGYALTWLALSLLPLLFILFTMRPVPVPLQATSTKSAADPHV